VLAVEAPRFEKEKEAGLRRILSSQHLNMDYIENKNQKSKKKTQEKKRRGIRPEVGVTRMNAVIVRSEGGKENIQK
jgi:hypothetical protein